MEIKHLSLGMVNAYLVKNNNAFFLIDSGIAMGRSTLEKSLEQVSKTVNKTYIKKAAFKDSFSK